MSFNNSYDNYCERDDYWEKSSYIGGQYLEEKYIEEEIEERARNEARV